MKLQPLGDRVLLKVEEGEQKTAGGLYIPQTAQEKTQIGTVIAVGDDKEAIKVKPKDRVMYDKYAGTSVKIDGEDHLIVKMQDILAIIMPNPKVRIRITRIKQERLFKSIDSLFILYLRRFQKSTS